MRERGLLVVVSGPSGAGKGTICKALMQRYDGIRVSVSATTRSPRAGEVDGVNYHFLTHDRFEEMISQQEFLEYAKVYDNYYGTPRQFVEDRIAEGVDVLLEIDIQGALQVKKCFPEGVFVFILPPSMKELKDRIVKRGSETEESLKKRFSSAIDEISFIKDYQYYIVNDEVERATEKLYAIIESEKCRVVDNIEELITRFKEELKC